MKRAILATLNYYHLWGNAPLSFVELYQYLIRVDGSLIHFSFRDFFDEVEKLVQNKTILLKNGYLGLKKDDFIFRESNYKTSLLKKKKLRSYLRFFLWLPIVKGLAVSGSLSMDNAQQHSDWDVLVLCQKRKIWLARFWLALMSQLISRRRYSNNIKDRFCWNLFLTSKVVPKEFQTWGNALMLSQLEVLFGKNAFASFLNKNKQWIKKKIYNFEYRGNYIWLLDNRLPVKFIQQLGKIGWPLFWLFSNNLARKMQIKRIKQKIKGKKIPLKYLYWSDDLLVFHYPPSKSVLAEEKIAWR